jgi:hypothetical protein
MGQVQPVLTVCLHHLRDVEPLTHSHDAHTIVEIKGITGKRRSGSGFSRRGDLALRRPDV